MKKKVLLSFLILIAIFFASAVTFALAMPQKTKPSDYNIGINYSQAKTSDKPMVALFYVDWCGYCMKFMPKYKIINDIYKNTFNFVMINAEQPQNANLVKSVNLTGFPTVYIIDPKYDNLVLLNGAIYQDLGKMRTELDRYARIRNLLDSAKK